MAPLAMNSACAQGAPGRPQDRPSVQRRIYGSDDRLEVYEHPDTQLQALARRSVLALIKGEHLERDRSGAYHLVGPTLETAFNVCDDQRFTAQLAIADCSAVLVDADLILTAGHCVTTESDCTDYAFVFDYYYRDRSRQRGAHETLEPEPIQASDVYGCRRIVARRHANNETTRVDFAFVQLDRAVVHRTAATIRATPLRMGEPLATIGCTSGLPFKIDAGAQVLQTAGPELGFFVLDSDTFFGSSGSGVFDEHHQLVGIIARGGLDYVQRGECMVPLSVSPETSPDGGVSAEEATYAGRAVDELCAAGWPSPRLCPFSAAAGQAPIATCSSTAPRSVHHGLPCVFISILVIGRRFLRRYRLGVREP